MIELIPKAAKEIENSDLFDKKGQNKTKESETNNETEKEKEKEKENNEDIVNKKDKIRKKT